MNKQPPKQFTFLFPITNLSETPPVHLLDLWVDGMVEIGRECEVLKISIFKINHIAKGEIFASDIKYFLRYTNPELHKQICDAALTYVTDKYGLKKCVLV